MIESDKAEVGVGYSRQKEQNMQKQSGRQGGLQPFFISIKGFLGIVAEALTSPGDRALQSVGISNPGKHKAPGQHSGP